MEVVDIHRVAGHRRGLVKERSVLANMYLHRDKSECVVSKLPLSGVLRVLKEEKAELVMGRSSLELRGFKEEKAQLVTGKSGVQVENISSHSDKRELIVRKVPLSGVLRVLEEEKAELVTGGSSGVLRDFKEKAELVTGKSGVQANIYHHHSDKSELIVCELPLTGVLRVLEEEKAELVTGK